MNEKLFKETQYNINKHNTAASRPDKMYNPTELERLDKRAQQSIQNFEKKKEEINYIKIEIMQIWTWVGKKLILNRVYSIIYNVNGIHYKNKNK